MSDGGDLPNVPSVRIDDAERDRAVAFLRHHCANGLITLDEFSERVGQVYAAMTDSDIDVVTNDLPAIQRAPLASAGGATAVATTGRKRRASRWTLSMFSANSQRGRWRVEGHTTAVSFMGGCQLDLRQAEVVGDEVTIAAFAFMGGVDVIVPEGIEVVLEGFSFMGGKQAAIKDVPVIPGSPLVRVRAFSFMGGVTVRSRRPPGETPRRTRSKSKSKQKHRDHDERRADRGRRRERGLDRERDRSSPRHEPRPPTLQLRRGIDAVAEDVRDGWKQLRSQVPPEGTVTIFFSDIEGFTSMNERLGDRKTQEVLHAHYRIVRDELLAHDGFEVKIHGDGFMLAFNSAARALRCARAIQEKQAAWSEANPETPIRLRMGLHTGEAIKDRDDDFLGSTVNLASRIATAARGNEILVSGLLKELCAGTGEFDFDGGQEIELKGLSQPHRVFSVDWR